MLELSREQDNNEFIYLLFSFPFLRFAQGYNEIETKPSHYKERGET